jgi:hypothetical protein
MAKTVDAVFLQAPKLAAEASWSSPRQLTLLSRPRSSIHDITPLVVPTFLHVDTAKQ